MPLGQAGKILVIENQDI